MTQFDALRIIGLRPETADAIVVTLAPPDELRARYRYLPGQHLTLRTWIAGREVRRVYSICSPVQEQRLEVAIKRAPKGLFSNWAHETLRIGDTIDALPPDGQFRPPPYPGSGRHYAGFAAGSGITPLLSIIGTLLEAEPESRFTLVYGSRSQDRMMFREALAALKNRYIERFDLIALFSREPQDCELLSGRLDTARCSDLFDRWLPVADIDHALLCGPTTMMAAVGAELSRRGLSEDRILREYFAPAADQPALPESGHLALPGGSDADHRQTTMRLDGITRSFTQSRTDQTLLEAAIAAGIDMPYACKSGVCGTCRCRLVEGEVAMSGPYALSRAEIDAGVVLSCRAIQTSAHATLDFDRQNPVELQPAPGCETRPAIVSPAESA